MNKRIISLLLVIVMALSLVACGAPAAEAPAATEAPAADNNVPMQYIKHDEAKELLNSDEYVFFDIRKAADSDANSIPGAQKWDMDAAKEGDAEAGKATMTKATEGLDKKIILVCYSGKRTHRLLPTLCPLSATTCPRFTPWKAASPTGPKFCPN